MTDKCSGGTLFLPFLDESGWIEGLRIFIYLIALLWCFMGVAIIADVFMCAIETITSKTKQVKRARQDSDEIDVVEIRIWNDTVANLSLMALGSSAPEILLAIIEITILNKFEAGELGPSTIVGSAAFNLFVITGVCVMTVPTPRAEKDQGYQSVRGDRFILYSRLCLALYRSECELEKRDRTLGGDFYFYVVSCSGCYRLHRGQRLLLCKNIAAGRWSP